MLQIKKHFITLASNYTSDTSVINAFWDEIETKYNETGRFYHTLHHLDFLVMQLLEVKANIQDIDVLLFSVFYHDIVYDPLRHDNEEKSAALAVERLKVLHFGPTRITRCEMQIMTTQSHTLSTDYDTNIFTDADLAILGQPWETYKKYASDVRKEYGMYQDQVYHEGRAKVMQHFLEMDRIYKTPVFYDKYEAAARINVGREIELLLAG